MFLDGKAAMVDAGAWETARMQSSPIANSVGFWWGPTFANGVGNQRVSMMVPTARLW
jgi:raffinose/stachyose/melibiose transport system substrate-binding protein